MRLLEILTLFVFGSYLNDCQCFLFGIISFVVHLTQHDSKFIYLGKGSLILALDRFLQEVPQWNIWVHGHRPVLVRDVIHNGFQGSNQVNTLDIYLAKATQLFKGDYKTGSLLFGSHLWFIAFFFYIHMYIFCIYSRKK